LVDDGSTDASDAIIKPYLSPQIRLLKLPRNAGKSAALWHGFKAAQMPWVALLDADLQTHPDDLPVLIKRLAHGYNGCTRAGLHRADNLTKRISTRVARVVRNAVLQDGFIDTVCPLGVYERQALLQLPAFSCYHRYIPYLLAMQGGKIAQEPIRHFARQHGKS